MLFPALVLLFFLLFVAELAAWAWWKRAAGRLAERVAEQQMGAEKIRFPVRDDRFIVGDKTCDVRESTFGAYAAGAAAVVEQTAGGRPLHLLHEWATLSAPRLNAFHIVLHRAAEERHRHLPPLICEEGFGVRADHRCLFGHVEGHLLQRRCLFTAPLGCSLAAWLEAAAPDAHVPLAVPLYVGLCDAVRELHEHGFLHRPGEEFASFYETRGLRGVRGPAGVGGGVIPRAAQRRLEPTARGDLESLLFIALDVLSRQNLRWRSSTDALDIREQKTEFLTAHPRAEEFAGSLGLLECDLAALRAARAAVGDAAKADGQALGEMRAAFALLLIVDRKAPAAARPPAAQPPAAAVEQLVDRPQPGDRPARPKRPVREVTVTMEGKNTLVLFVVRNSKH
ncbi:Serine threonine protein kinase-related domain containing protein [Aphelenchoides fujianensis]|nr:Serine threonine protein kinase-related domain containing protein [Aphelenchoides fujianensis]